MAVKRIDKNADNDNFDSGVNIVRYNINSLKNNIIINANQMIDLNGKIDTFKLVDKATLDRAPIMQYEDAEGNALNDNKSQKYWLNEIEKYIRYLLRVNDEDISNIGLKELKQKAVEFNLKFMDTYINGINNYSVDLIDTKETYANHLASALADLQAMEIGKIGIIGFNLLDLKKDISTIKQYMSIDRLIEVQDTFRKLYPSTNIEDVSNGFDINIIKSVLYQHQLLDSIKQVEQIIKDNQEHYNKLHKKHQEIHKLIKSIVNKYKQRDDELSKNGNYDVIKFSNNNDIVSKLDPITKGLLSGKNYEVGKLIKTKNNYNSKEYGAVFSIKASDLTNADIVQELKQKGININHFDKKIIDDVDVLLDENKGNVNNNDKLVALTTKMIAKKVYNVKQPTKKQQEEIESRLNYLNNIYLFLVKDDATADKIEKLVQLKDKGLKYLQDKEGNVLNIGDTLEDNIILNAQRGYSAKYNSLVYVFDNKSIFERINNYINDDVGKQLKLSLKNRADEIFDDYNKNVNNIVVCIRCFLFERVNQIKHSIVNNTKQNKEILLSNIYDENKITDIKSKKKVRDIIKNILNHWIDINLIGGYKFLDKDNQEIKKNSTKEIYKIYIDVNVA